MRNRWEIQGKLQSCFLGFTYPPLSSTLPVEYFCDDVFWQWETQIINQHFMPILPQLQNTAAYHILTDEWNLQYGPLRLKRNRTRSEPEHNLS